MSIDQFGIFAEKPEAIKTLKQSMEDFCKFPDRRNLTLTLHFNNLWKLGKKYTDLFHAAMVEFFKPTSEGQDVINKADLSEGDKLKAIEVALLAKVLVQNHHVINIGHYSDDVTPRNKLLSDTVEGLIKAKFGSNPEIQQKLFPLKDVFQREYDRERNAVPVSTPTFSRSAPAA
jgi:hypothetical protein